MMKEYLKNYIDSFISVADIFFSNDIEVKSIEQRETILDANELSVIIGFVGDIKGQAYFTMSNDVAMNLTEFLAEGIEITEIDDIVKSAVGEFGNMVMGRSSTLMSDDGIYLDITPPSIVTGENISVCSSSPVYCNDMRIDQMGNISFDVAFLSD